MSTVSMKVTLDLHKGSAYEYDKDSLIPTTISFIRLYGGEYQYGLITGNISNHDLHNIVYMIKRGYEPEEIKYGRDELKFKFSKARMSKRILNGLLEAVF
jgi:hypothetical protein